MKRLKSPIPDAINCSPQNSFTQIPNELLRNPEISAKAKTILAILLSNRIGWKSHVELLITMMKEGKESIRTGLTELEKFQYLKRVRYQDKVSKRYMGIFWAYTDEPGNFNMMDNLLSLESMGYAPELEKPALENPILNKKTRSFTRAGTRVRDQKNIIPPKLSWIKEYCLQRKNEVDAQQFFDFYASKGWKVGNTHMIDWQASVRTWERKDKETAVKHQKYKKPYIIDDGIQYDLAPDGKYRHCVTGEVYIP